MAEENNIHSQEALYEALRRELQPYVDMLKEMSRDLRRASRSVNERLAEMDRRDKRIRKIQKELGIE